MTTIRWMLFLVAGAAALALPAGAWSQENGRKPWEEAAMNAVQAINSGNADLFLAWTHPAEQHRLKQKFMERVLTPTPGKTPEEQLRPYGLRSVDQLARMTDAAFVAVAIPYQYSANDAVMREAMAKAAFTIIKSSQVEEGHYRVHIALHVPLEVKPLDRELVANVVRTPDGWKYNGLQ